MVNFIKRLVFVDKDEASRVPILFWPFLWATFFYGVGFTFFFWWGGVTDSSLYRSMSDIHATIPYVWGIFAMLASGFCVTLLVSRGHRYWGSSAAMIGSMVWMFAACCYILTGFWLVCVTVALPNLFFWIYYYVGVRRYVTEKTLGHIVDPD